MSLQEIVAGFNWVDIVIICLILITAYSGMRQRFIIQLFKTAGVIFSVFISVHYFSAMSDFLLRHVPNFGVYFADPLCFVVLACLPYIFVYLLRVGFCRLVKVEAVNVLDRWGGFALGIARGLLIASLLAIFLNVSFITYLQRSVRKSSLGKPVAYFNLDMYEFFFNHLVSKFYPQQSINKNVYDIIENEREDPYREEK